MGGASVHTKTFVGKMFYKFLSTFMKKVFSIILRFLNKIMLILSQKVILNSTVLKYPRYKKVVLDEIPKTRFSDMKKLQKTKKY